MEIQNPLWVFALKVYAKPLVEKQLLELQATFGLSINRILFAGWLATQNKAYQPEALEMSSAAQWQVKVTHPLRALRYQVRSECAENAALQAFYKAMRQAELLAEQVEIAYLYQLSLSWGEVDEAKMAEDLMLKNLCRVTQAQGISDEKYDILLFLSKEMLSVG
jgi:uncharacterized protein (TIGR02444 family)